LTSLALFAAFVGIAGISAIDIYKADVLAGLFVGGMIPFIFSALAISAVGKAAMEMVNEVRRQFREIPGIMEYEAEPEYEKCVAISTEASLRQMLLPGAIALVVPVLVGFTMGPEVLGGVLAGVTVSGVLMGMFQSNAGGAWDNAKKSFEKGVMIDGQMYYKKSEPHKASVTGDTVGDPFKDTSGPSMNILIKLMSIVSLVIAPYIAVTSGAVVMTETIEVMAENNGSGVEVNKYKLELDNGLKMDISTPGNPVEIGLIDFIRSEKPVDKVTWFDFDRLTFETGSAKLDAASSDQLTNVADILKAFPAVAIKLGGYTDNTGNADNNLKLSVDRAKSVMQSLVAKGVEASRIESEGYGDQHPVASNDTEEGRNQNRRISIRVTEK
jgi:K(+)-stimulated pyrophosphate-energized sodium pump